MEKQARYGLDINNNLIDLFSVTDYPPINPHNKGGKHSHTVLYIPFGFVFAELDSHSWY